MADWGGSAPRWLTPVAEDDVARGDGDRAAEFIERFCSVTKDSFASAAGQPIELRGWQRELLAHLLARREDGRLRHRQALIGMPRKSGKSALLSSLTLYMLLFGPAGGEVYAAASSRDQARIVFDTTRRMVEMHPELSGALNLYRDAIEDVSTGSVMRVLAAEAPQLEGLNPTAVCYDELHTAPNRELWDVLALASGARMEPLMVGITTAGVRYDSRGNDTLCYSMWQYGCRVAAGEVADPSFFMSWWAPEKPDADFRDPETWRQANPGYGDLSDPEDFESTVNRTPEPEFRTKRLNQWVDRSSAWLSAEAIAAVTDVALGRRVCIADGEAVVLAFDGSFSNDSTALVACSVDGVPRVEVVGLWERPANAQGWTVDVLEVEQAIRDACRKWQVLEVAADPHRWSRSLEVLRADGLPVEVFPQSPGRMTPATQRFFEAVANQQIVLADDPALRRHLASAVLKVDARGTRIVKESRNSARKIDAAVAAVMALDRAAWWSAERSKPRPVRKVYGF